MGVWVVQQLMWHTSIVIDNFPHWWVPRPLEPGEVLFAQMPVKSCTVEVVIRKGIIGWMEKKETQYIVSTSARVMQAIRAVTEFYGPWFVPTFKNKIFPTWETPWLLEKRPQQWAFKYHFQKCALNIFATADAKGLEDLMLFSWAGNNWSRKPQKLHGQSLSFHASFFQTYPVGLVADSYLSASTPRWCCT